MLSHRADPGRSRPSGGGAYDEQGAGAEIRVGASLFDQNHLLHLRDPVSPCQPAQVDARSPGRGIPRRGVTPSVPGLAEQRLHQLPRERVDRQRHVLRLREREVDRGDWIEGIRVDAIEPRLLGCHLVRGSAGYSCRHVAIDLYGPALQQLVPRCDGQIAVLVAGISEHAPLSP